jgi:hypothetical protein
MDLLEWTNAFLLGTRFAQEVRALGLRLPHGGRSGGINIDAWREPRHGCAGAARMILSRSLERSWGRWSAGWLVGPGRGN